MFGLVVDTATFVLMAAIATHSIILHIRLRRFRHSLADVGDMLGTLDASIVQMTTISTGFSERLQTELAAIDASVETARRLGGELEAAGRMAATATVRLERVLRQHRQAEAADTPASHPRVEPKGFAERFGRSRAASSNSGARSQDKVSETRTTDDELQPVTA